MVAWICGNRAPPGQIMHAECCPNCGTAHTALHERCHQCGWMPLRSTELIFVESESIVCPVCSAQRPLEGDACPECGTAQILETLSNHTLNFKLSSAFLLTTFIAICVALMRLSPGLGVIAVCILSCAALRTGLLIRERKRHRYPTNGSDMWCMFGLSFLGIVFAIGVFGFTSFIGAILVMALVDTILLNSQWAAAVGLSVLVIAIYAVSIVLICRDRRNYGVLFVGLIVGFSAAAVMAIAVAMIGVRHAGWTMVFPLATFGLGATAMACLHQSGAKIRAYLTGHCLAVSLVGLISLTDGSLRNGFAEALWLTGLWLVPVLFGVLILEKLWRWDDAFPRTISRSHRELAGRDGQAAASGQTGGIEFICSTPATVCPEDAATDPGAPDKAANWSEKVEGNRDVGGD